MEKVGLAAAATAAAGGLIALQPPLLARVADSVGPLAASSINFLVGSVCLVALTLLVGSGLEAIDKLGSLPWYYLVGGGLVGAIYVTVVVVAVGALGAAGVVAATIAGQLTASVALDRLGALGLEQAPITPERLLGVALLIAGTYFVVR